MIKGRWLSIPPKGKKGGRKGKKRTKKPDALSPERRGEFIGQTPGGMWEVPLRNGNSRRVNGQQPQNNVTSVTKMKKDAMNSHETVKALKGRKGGKKKGKKVAEPIGTTEWTLLLDGRERELYEGRSEMAIELEHHIDGCGSTGNEGRKKTLMIALMRGRKSDSRGKSGSTGHSHGVEKRRLEGACA